MAGRLAAPVVSTALPGASDPDPCGFQQTIRLPAGSHLTSVTRVQPDAPFAWACVYQFGVPTLSLEVETTTTGRLAAGGAGTPGAVLQALSAQTSVDPAKNAPVVSFDAGAGARGAAVGGTDLYAISYPSDGLPADRQTVLTLRLTEDKRCLEVIDKLRRLVIMQSVTSKSGGFGDPFVFIAGDSPVQGDPDLQDCWSLGYDPEHILSVQR